MFFHPSWVRGRMGCSSPAPSGASQGHSPAAACVPPGHKGEFSGAIRSGVAESQAQARFQQAGAPVHKPSCSRTLREQESEAWAGRGDVGSPHPPGTGPSFATAKIHSTQRQFRGGKGACQSYHLGTVVA